MRLREIRSHVYWHASDEPKIKQLEPVYSALVDREVVYAATYPEVAVAMAFHWNDKDFRFGRTMRKGTDPKTVPYTLKELKAGMFDKFFRQPVSLYEVDARTFDSDPNIQDFEVVSDKPVKVEEEHRIEDPLDYLRNSKMVKLIPFKS